MKNSNYYSNVDSLSNISMGKTLPVSENIARSLKRTGKETRNLHAWANVFQVDIPGFEYYCDLWWHDNGEILIQKGSDLN